MGDYKTPALRSVDSLILAFCVVLLVGYTAKEFDPHGSWMREAFSFARAPWSSQNLAMASDIELLYFDVKGRGEGSRMLLSAANLSFTDRRVTGDEWRKELKPNREQFHFGQLPVLHATFPWGEEVWVAQSNAIARYISRSGTRPLSCESVACSEMLWFQEDVRSDWAKHGAGAKDPTKFLEVAASRLSALSSWLERSGSFVTGHEMTYVDILLFDALEAALDKVPEKRASLLNGAEGVQAFLERVKGHELLENYSM